MKFLRTFSAATLLLLCFVQCAFAASAPPETSIKEELHLDYLEFYENQDYYNNLARTEGYRLVVYVGEEYAELEEARIASESESVHTLIPVTTRGLSIPSKGWNIANKGPYSFKGIAQHQPLYTDCYITGYTSYKVTAYNGSNAKTSAQAWGVRVGFEPFSCPARSTVIEYFVPTSSSSHFYLKFFPYVDIKGTIAKDI